MFKHLELEKTSNNRGRYNIYEYTTLTVKKIQLWRTDDPMTITSTTKGFAILVRLHRYIESGYIGSSNNHNLYYLVSYSAEAIFTPQPLRAPGYCRTPSGRAAGQTSPVNTLTSIIFHGSFSNLARTFITIRSRTSSIMEVLPH